MRRKQPWVRRVCTLVAALVALTVAVPIGQTAPTGGSEFPLAPVWEWLAARPVWSFDRLPTPEQKRGGAFDSEAFDTRDTSRANGHAPGKVPNALAPYVPYGRPESGAGRGSLPDNAGACARQAPDESRAALLARRCGYQVEVLGSRSETAQVWAQPDGTFRTRMHVSPQRFLDDGVWRDTDLTLVKQADGSVAPKAHPRGLRLAGATPGVSADGVEVVSTRTGAAPASARVGLRWAGRLPAPVLDGAKATYVDVLPGIDLVVEVSPTGYEQFWIVKSAKAVPLVRRLQFGLVADGLTVRANKAGGLDFLDGGTVVAGTPTPLMWDAAIDERSGEPTHVRPLGLSVARERTAGAARGLRLSVDESWLTDPRRRFPVTIDPTLTADGDTFVQTSRSSSQFGSDELKLGTYDGGGDVARSFLRWNWSPVFGKDILSATLNLWEWHAYSCRSAEWQLWIAGWVDHTTTWANKPAPLQYFHSSTQTRGHPDCTGDGWVSIAATNLVQKVADEEYVYYTMNLKAANETDSDSWKRFNSGDAAAGRPYLDVTWRNEIPQIEGQYPPHGYASPTLTPELLVEAKDIDNWPNAMTYQFLVYDPASATPTTPIADSGWTSSRRYVVPSGKLAWSKNYVWTVLASDGQDVSTSQAMNSLATAVPQAPITSQLSQNSGKGFAPSVGNYTTSTVDAQVPTVGPALAVSRSYNSRDPRAGLAFGSGWSSLLDAKAVEQTDPGAGAPRAVAITYPTGQEVAFGRNSDGSFTPPAGRFSTLRKVTSPEAGYELVDKMGTKYLFTAFAATGGFGLRSITDAQGRTLRLDYTSGRVTTLTAASGRHLHITWTADGKHVATVKTDPLVAGDWSTANTWTYTYTGDSLTTVCPPTSTTDCTVYTYGSNWAHPTAVQDAAPHTYLRLNEAAGAATAASSVVDNLDTAVGAYHNVSLGQPGIIAQSGAAAGFNGTSSDVELPNKLALSASWMSVSLWFKTTSSGVIYGFQNKSLADSANATTWNPALYVDTSGYLHGELWIGAVNTIKSAAPVNDGTWHHVVLTGYGTTQEMYLDGQKVGLRTGNISPQGATNVYIGAGKWSTWPGSSGTVGYFNGSISDFAFYTKPLQADQVSLLHASGVAASSPLTKITRPSGGITAQVVYDPVSGVVRQVTDANNGVWAIGDPQISGTGQVYSSVVMSQAPADYFRLAGTANEVNGVTGEFHDVTFGGANTGPFGESAAGFSRAAASHMLASGPSIDTSKSYSLSAWVYLADEVWNQQVVGIDGNTLSPFLFGYVENVDGWRMLVCQDDSTTPVCPGVFSTSKAEVNTWTHLAATVDASTRTVKLYVNGKMEGSTVVPALWKAQGSMRIGGLKWHNGYPDPWSGRLAEVATFQTVLTDQQVLQQYEARQKAVGGGAGAGVPVKTITVTDPGGQDTSYVYDLMAGGRQIQQIDANNGVTTYGYDVGGFLRTTTDPLGNMTIEEHDVRGNVIAKTTCQDRSESKCSTIFSTYYPDSTTKVLTPDPRNDLLLETRDGRSSSSTDDTYLTTNTYDANGNLVQVTDPLDRVNKILYSNGKRIPADLTGLSGSGRYVRVYGTKRGYPAGYSLWEFEVFGPDGRNVARRRPVTASSDESGSVPPYMAVDGDPATRWASQHSDPQWIYVDLGAVYDISRVRLTWETAFGEDYEIQVSGDAATWTTIKTVTGQDGTPVPAGLPIRKTLPNGAVETVYYTATGDVSETVDAAGLVTAYEYDRLGRVVTKTVKADAGDLVTTLTYDRLNRVETQTDPAVTNRVTGAVHTAVTTTVYNDDGRALTQTISDATGGDAPRTVENTYNTLGQLVSVKDALGNIRTYTHDVYGNKVTETDPSGTTMAYTYDAAGQLEQTTLKAWTGDPNNPQAPDDIDVFEMRDYDKAGRLKTVTDAMGWVTAYTYTDNGLVASITRHGAAGESFVVESNEYDPAGNLIKQWTNNGTTLTEFEVDDSNRITKRTVDNGGLTRWTKYGYGLDDTLLWEQTSNGAEPATASQVVDRTYDLAGRMTSQTVSAWGTWGQVGRWKLDETSGTVADDVAGNTPASGSPIWSADVRSGAGGGSASFDGLGGGLLSTKAPVLDTTQSFTVMAWAKLADKSSGRIIASQRGEFEDAFRLEYSVASDRWTFVLPAADTASGNTYQSAGSDAAPTLGVWTHLTGVYDATTGTAALYVNGVKQADVSSDTRAWGARGQFHIGHHGSGGNLFKGHIDDVAAFQAALSQWHVTQFYNGKERYKQVRTSWQLDKRGLPVSEVDPAGNVTYYEYDEAGQPASTTSPTVAVEENGGAPVPAAAVSTVGYNTFGEVVENRDPTGLVTTTIRDAAGQATEVRLPSYTPPGSATPVNPIAKTQYDASGQVIKTTDPLLNETTYVYDQLGRLAKVTAPNGGETKYTYTLNGEQLSVTDANGARSEATYDYLGRKETATAIERSPAMTHDTNYVYDAAGRLQSVTPEGRSATTYEYNVLGELTKVTDGAGNPTRFEYDFAGRKTATIAADGSKQTVEYDDLGRPTVTRRLSPAETVLTTTSVAYDANGNVVSTTDARGHTTTFAYDATDLITQVVQPVSEFDSITISFGYDITGKPTRYTDGRGNDFLTTYNSWGKVESEIEPGGATFTIAYDAAGQPVTQSAPGGVTVTNAYNSMGELISQTGTGADAPTAGRGFDYDLAGRLTEVTEGPATTGLSYNDRGLLTSVSGAAGASTFTWTDDGLMASRQDASGTSTYTYDSAGRLSTITDASTGEPATYAYNNLSQVTSITYGASGNKRSFTYDALHRLETDSLARPDTSTIASIIYGYDENGNETSKTTTGFAGSSTNTYTYDYANRLTSWNDGTTTTAYAYDKSGNRTQIGTRTFTYNSRNQLVSDGNATYSYTPRGTLSGTTEGTVTTPSTFDAYGQQISQGTQTYSYDGLGRVLTASSGATFTYSGAGNHVASDGTATYSRDPAGDLVGVKAGATGVFAWSDLHDDVVAQFTSTGTTLSGSRTYNPFGTVLAASGLLGNLGYQSGWTDPATSRVNMHARWYNPATAQFASRDTVSVSPLPNPIRANRYAYGDGNPLTVTDPSGHWGSWLKSAWNKTTSAVSTAWNKTTSAVSSAARWVGSKVSQAYNWVRNEARELRDWARRKWQQAKDWAVQKFNDVKETVKETYRRAKQAYNHVKQRAQAVVRAAAEKAQRVAEAAAKVVEHHKQVLADAYKATANWIEEHKAQIVGFAVGAVVGIGCGALIGWTGVGAVACGALAGAAGSLVTGLMEGKSGWDLVGDVALGAVSGALLGGLGSMIGQGIAAGAKGLVGAGLKTAASRFAGAFKAEGANIIGGFKGLGTKAGGGLKNLGNRLTTGFKNAFKGCAKKPRHSFDPKTPVLLANGQKVAIDQVKVGDKVVATDPKTGRTEAKSVTALHVNVDNDLTDLTVLDAKTGKKLTVKTTQHHPFWSATRDRWVDAADLRPGERLRDDEGKETQRVVAVKTWTGLQQMRDLTVADIHTYYVVAADTPILVHNIGGCGETTPLYRVPRNENAADELQNGLDPRKFPRDAESDGAAHFGNEARVRDFAQSHSESHGSGYCVNVPTCWLNNHIDNGSIEVWEGIDDDQLEYVIPYELFDELNEFFPATPWNPGGQS